MSMRRLDRKFMPLEICIEDEAGARSAIRGGADRLELCCALDVGGLTPSFGLMQVLRESAIPIVVLVRPRAGGFVFTASEKAVMAHDVKAAAACGMHGVALGAVTDSGNLDAVFLADMIALARSVFDRSPPLLTLNRAIDTLIKPDLSVHVAADLGFQRILTSGGATTVIEGRDMIRSMIAKASGRLSIMAGGGVRAENVSAFVSEVSPDEIHASARQALKADERLRNLGFASHQRQTTSEWTVRALRDQLSRV